jgi:hypothetical protein
LQFDDIDGIADFQLPICDLKKSVKSLSPNKSAFGIWKSAMFFSFSGGGLRRSPECASGRDDADHHYRGVDVGSLFGEDGVLAIYRPIEAVQYSNRQRPLGPRLTMNPAQTDVLSVQWH